MSLNHLINEKELNINVKTVDTDSVVSANVTADTATLDIVNATAITLENLVVNNSSTVENDASFQSYGTTKSIEYGNEGNGQIFDTSQYNYIIRQEAPGTQEIQLLKGGSTMGTSAGYPYIRCNVTSTGHCYNIIGHLVYRLDALSTDFTSDFQLRIRFKMKPEFKNSEQQGDIPGADTFIAGGASGMIILPKVPGSPYDAVGLLCSDPFQNQPLITHLTGNEYEITETIISQNNDYDTTVGAGWEFLRLNFSYSVEVQGGRPTLQNLPPPPP